jgi:hypothetical protein
VGYGSPPAEHRFQKGRSGNPRGRPRKAKRDTSSIDLVFSNYMSDLVLAEAARPIQIRENGKTIELPMIQAVVRSLGVAALKGSHRAQVALTGMVQATQEKTITELTAVYSAAKQYKEGWDEVFAQYDARGQTRPDPVPHPHDMKLDDRKFRVIFNGPQTEDEKAKWDELLARREAALEEVAQYRRLASRKSKYRDFYLEEMEREQRLADVIGSVMPPPEIRRKPGFDIRVWREKQEAWQKIRLVRRKDVAGS